MAEEDFGEVGEEIVEEKVKKEVGQEVKEEVVEEVEEVHLAASPFLFSKSLNFFQYP